MQLLKLYVEVPPSALAYPLDHGSNAAIAKALESLAADIRERGVSDVVGLGVTIRNGRAWLS